MWLLLWVVFPLKIVHYSKKFFLKIMCKEASSSNSLTLTIRLLDKLEADSFNNTKVSMKILRDNCGSNGLFHGEPRKQFKGYRSGSEVGSFWLHLAVIMLAFKAMVFSPVLLKVISMSLCNSTMLSPLSSVSYYICSSISLKEENRNHFKCLQCRECNAGNWWHWWGQS